MPQIKVKQKIEFEVVRGIGKKSGAPWKALKMTIDGIPAFNNQLWFPTDLEIKVMNEFFTEVGYLLDPVDPQSLEDQQNAYIEEISK